MVGWRFIVTAKPTSGSNPNACVPEGRPGGTLVEMSKTSDAMGSNMGAGQISQPRGNSRHGILSPHTGSPSGPFSIAPLRQSSPAHHPADESHLSICRRCVGLQSLCCARVKRERTKDPKSTADAAMRAPRRCIGVAMSRYSSLSVSPSFNNSGYSSSTPLHTHCLTTPVASTTITTPLASTTTTTPVASTAKFETPSSEFLLQGVGFLCRQFQKLLHFCGKGDENPCLEES